MVLLSIAPETRFLGPTLLYISHSNHPLCNAESGPSMTPSSEKCCIVPKQKMATILMSSPSSMGRTTTVLLVSNCRG